MTAQTLKDTWTAFAEDKAMRLATVVAFSAIFSLAPLFIVLIAIVGWVIGIAQGGHGHHVAEKTADHPAGVDPRVAART